MTRETCAQPQYVGRKLRFCGQPATHVAVAKNYRRPLCAKHAHYLRNEYGSRIEPLALGEGTTP